MNKILPCERNKHRSGIYKDIKNRFEVHQQDNNSHSLTSLCLKDFGKFREEICYEFLVSSVIGDRMKSASLVCIFIGGARKSFDSSISPVYVPAQTVRNEYFLGLAR